MSSPEVERRLNQHDADIYSLYEISTRIESKVDRLAERTDARFDQLTTNTDARFDQINGKLDQLTTNTDARFDLLTTETDARFDAISRDIAAHGSLLEQILRRLDQRQSP